MAEPYLEVDLEIKKLKEKIERLEAKTKGRSIVRSKLALDTASDVEVVAEVLLAHLADSLEDDLRERLEAIARLHEVQGRAGILYVKDGD